MLSYVELSICVKLPMSVVFLVSVKLSMSFDLPIYVEHCKVLVCQVSTCCMCIVPILVNLVAFNFNSLGVNN